MQEFRNKLLDRRLKLVTRLTEIKKSGDMIVGYGAPAKVTTLLHFMGIGDLIDYIVDDSSLKVGRFTPGTHIPIVSSERLYKDNPEHIVILAWNFADSIIEKLHANGFEGECIIP